VIWHRLAVKLGWPVQLLQRLTTSKEFNRWKTYLAMEPNEFNPLFYYLAAIAFIIARVNAKNPERIRLEDFLLKFEAKAKKEEGTPLWQQSKAAWLSALGIKRPKKTPRKKHTHRKSMRG
jgi:hypothetical protein